MKDEPLSYRMAYFQAQNRITALEKQVEELRKEKQFAELLVIEKFDETHWQLFLELQKYWIDGECYCISRNEGGTNQPCAHCTSGVLLKKLGWSGDITQLRQAIDSAAKENK